MSGGIGSDDASAWLLAFQQAVASGDIDAGRRLFAEDVEAYGTRTSVMSGLDMLVDQQWRPVWAWTRDFHFTHTDYQQRLESISVVAARWESVALGGQRREGRCTLVLSGRYCACTVFHCGSKNRWTP